MRPRDPLFVNQTGHANLVRFFLSRGILPSVSDVYAQTPLHAAAIAGSAACAQELLDHGAKEDAADANGFTPYDLAKRDPELRKDALAMFKAREVHRVARGPARLLRLLCFSSDGDSRLWQRLVIAAILCGYFVYLTYLQHLLSSTADTAFILTQLVLWALWVWVVYRDPGTFRPTEARRKQYDAALARFGSPSITDEQAREIAARLCHTCRVVRPTRVHHSSFTHSCIVDYDHYCDFMVTAIAINNRRQFVTTIFLLTASLVFGIVEVSDCVCVCVCVRARVCV